MSWELLTHTKFHGASANMSHVVEVLLGAKQLPSEQELTAEAQRGLGNSVFRNSIVAALHRDPKQRPTVAQLVQDWTSVLCPD